MQLNGHWTGRTLRFNPVCWHVVLSYEASHLTNTFEKSMPGKWSEKYRVGMEPNSRTGTHVLKVYGGINRRRLTTSYALPLYAQNDQNTAASFKTKVKVNHYKKHKNRFLKMKKIKPQKRRTKMFFL